ncbi:MAG: AI-2E family transporter [Acidobacteria bacterium]|nr:MAG: AI-2E family transporter [Acidobacteriota bacterium]
MTDQAEPTRTRAAAADPLPPTPGAPGEPPPTVAGPHLNPGTIALIVIAAIAVIFTLQAAQSVLIPIVIAVLISYAMGPLVTSLARHGVARAIGAALAVIVLFAAAGIGAYTLTDQVLQIAEQVPVAAQRVRERVREHRLQKGGALQTVQRAANEVERTANEAANQAQPSKPQTGVTQVEVVEPAFNISSFLWAGGLILVNALGNFAVILFLVYFFLVTGDLYKRKLVKIAGPHLAQKKITVQILDEINSQIESFMRVQVFTSALVAVATALALWWFGLPQYIVWGLLAGVFNSIPYLGPVIVTGGLGLVAFLQFDSVSKTVLVCLVALAITSLEGLLLTPALLSRAGRMNAAAVFTGLLFWSWIWGVWGTILAVPMLMMLKAICDHIEDLQPIGELLGE